MLPESRLSKISTSYPHLTQTTALEHKVAESHKLNNKLQQLFHSLKSNTHIKTLSHSQSSSLLSKQQNIQLKKTLEKLNLEVQHMKHLENLLLSETKQLKEQVNNRRKERVIYSNIFKKYQKDIQKWQARYKESLLDNMATADAQNSIKQKIAKIKRRFEKEIKELETIKLQKYRQKKLNAENSQSKIDQRKQRTSRKKTTFNNQSYKKLLTQKQLELKAKSMETEFEKESKKIMYEALAEQVLKIAGTDNLHEAISLIKNIDTKTQQIYHQYEQLEKTNKEKETKCSEFEQNILEKSSTQRTVSTEKEISQIMSLSDQIQEEERKMSLLEEQLSVKLDVNCRKLPTDQLASFIDRMMLTRKKNEEVGQQEENTARTKSEKAGNLLSAKDAQKLQRRSKNVLEKKLEKVEKEKEINDYLLTYSEINKFMLGN